MAKRHTYPNGPGKYDAECEAAREVTNAEGVLLIVMNGGRGNGFSACFSDPSLMMGIPSVLRLVADEIEQQNKRGMQ